MNFYEFQISRILPPASPFPYLIYKGMSHTFDIRKSLFSKIFRFFGFYL